MGACSFLPFLVCVLAATMTPCVECTTNGTSVQTTDKDSTSKPTTITGSSSLTSSNTTSGKESTRSEPPILTTSSASAMSTTNTAETNSASDIVGLPIIIGAAAGGAVVLILILVVIIIACRKCRKKARKGKGERVETGSVHSDNPESNLVVVEPASIQEKTKERNGGATASLNLDVLDESENNEDSSDHVYVNTLAGNAAAADTKANPTPPQQVIKEDLSLRLGEGPGADETKESLEDVPACDGHDVEIYRRFLQTNPDIDRLQKSLVERLSWAQLPKQFKKLDKSVDSPKATATSSSNSKKNRFANIVPYDENRVVLKDGYDLEGSTDFMNASYIKGYKSKKVYIAAQGPRDSTVVDFWRMVWQEEITHIVMLTNTTEMGKSKCHQYWPHKHKTRTFGPFTIACVDEETEANFITRKFKLNRSENEECREVVQHHFTTWSDHGVPSTTALVRFWRHITSQTLGDTAPLLVHCSAGVGRTGTFIGLDIGMAQATQEGEVDVEQLVVELRKERCFMVQAVEQYVFLHKALLEAYTARDTFMEAEEFGMLMPDPVHAHSQHPRVDKKFHTLIKMQSLTEQLSHDFAVESENLCKNRSTVVMLPADDHLVYLTEHFPGRNQYINAVYVSTKRDTRGRILTQLPLPNTLIDFWRMVYGNNVTTIVSLAHPDEEHEVQPYCWYWPRSLGDREALRTGAYVIKLQSSCQRTDNLTTYTVTLEKQKSPPRTVNLLRYEGWPGEVPDDASDLLRLVEELNDTHKDGEGAPVVIQCSDGVTKSGLFSAVCDVITRMMEDHEVDVYMTVRHLQTIRPQAVTSLAQYRFCYEIAQLRLQDMGIYANT